MKIFIMAILLGQLDLMGNVFYTTFEENPKIEFVTMEECLTAAKIKGDEMYKSSLKYPDLDIVHIKINCVEEKTSLKDTI